MKYVLGILVALNVICAASALRPNASDPAVQLPDLAVPTVRLVGEREPDPGGHLPEGLAAAGHGNLGTASREGPTGAIEGAPGGVIDVASSDPPTRVDLGGSEERAAGGQKDEVPAPLGMVPGANSRDPAACSATFDAREDVERRQAAVVARGGEAWIEEQVVDRKPGYLVYIPTSGSRDEARRLSRELTAREIDCHIIASGALAHSLSVGVFDRRELADRQRRRVAALGYEVDLREWPRSRTVYRLVAREPLSGTAAAENCDA